MDTLARDRGVLEMIRIVVERRSFYGRFLDITGRLIGVCRIGPWSEQTFVHK